MAQKANTATVAETAPATATAPKFTVGRLREKCYTLFGVTTSTFDGATNGLDGEYTIEEMKNRIAKWQNKEVK